MRALWRKSCWNRSWHFMERDWNGSWSWPATQEKLDRPIIGKCGRDELVSSLLLLYGLHPDDLTTRVTSALAKSQSSLESHAARAELISIQDDGTVTVRLHLKPNGGCGSTAASVKLTLEAALQNAAPDAPSIVVEETGAAPAGFVSVAQLTSGQALDALSVARSERSGD